MFFDLSHTLTEHPPTPTPTPQGLRLKPSLRKLHRSRSQVMLVYYAFVWAISLLNLMRCLAQLVPATGAWNLLWLAARFGGCRGLPRIGRGLTASLSWRGWRGLNGGARLGSVMGSTGFGCVLEWG